MKLSLGMSAALQLAAKGGLTRVGGGCWIPQGWTPGMPYATVHTVAALERRSLVKYDSANHVILCQNKNKS